jgi:hypothetical protein
MATETDGFGLELTVKVKFADAELSSPLQACTITWCVPADMEMLGLIVAVAPVL